MEWSIVSEKVTKTKELGFSHVDSVQRYSEHSRWMRFASLSFQWPWSIGTNISARTQFKRKKIREMKQWLWIIKLINASGNTGEEYYKDVYTLVPLSVMQFAHRKSLKWHTIGMKTVERISAISMLAFIQIMNGIWIISSRSMNCTIDTFFSHNCLNA